MRATPLALVLILLSTMTRAGEAQLLPRRRVVARVEGDDGRDCQKKEGEIFL